MTFIFKLDDESLGIDSGYSFNLGKQIADAILKKEAETGCAWKFGGMKFDDVTFQTSFIIEPEIDIKGRFVPLSDLGERVIESIDRYQESVTARKDGHSL